MIAEATSGAGVVVSDTNIAISSKTLDAGGLLQKIQSARRRQRRRIAQVGQRQAQSARDDRMSLGISSGENNDRRGMEVRMQHVGPSRFRDHLRVERSRQPSFWGQDRVALGRGTHVPRQDLGDQNPGAGRSEFGEGRCDCPGPRRPGLPRAARVRHPNLGGPGPRSDWMSSSKPLLSTLLFFAIQEGKVPSVNAKVKSYGWDLRAKDEAMTFHHLANMISGYARPEEPGAAWAYNDYAINLYRLTLFDRSFGRTRPGRRDRPGAPGESAIRGRPVFQRQRPA